MNTLILHQSTRMTLDDLEPPCVAQTRTRSKSNMELSCLPIFHYYCLDVLEGKKVNGI